MSEHIHQPSTYKEQSWTACVTPVECAEFPVQSEAHSGIVFTETCECGAVRMGERSGYRVNIGNWSGAAQAAEEPVVIVAEEPVVVPPETQEAPPAGSKSKKN